MDKNNSIFSITKEEVLFDGKFITVTGRYFHNRKTGGNGLWECVKRKTFGNIVAVVALTPDHQLILIKIFRLPLEGWIIEFCAGLADKRGQTEIELAGQELRQETGYQAEKFVHLMSGPFNAGLTGERLSVYLGLNAVKVSEPELETGEDIEVISVPLDKAHDFLTNPPDGVSVDLKLFGVIHHPKLRELIS